VRGPAAGEGPRAAALVVYVTGEVVRPGLYRFAEGTRIDDAVRAAGGFTTRGDRLSTDLAEPLRDGEEVLIAPAGAVDPYSTAVTQGRGSPGLSGAARTRRRTRSRTPGSRRGRTSRKPLPSAPVDLNGADATQLATLPGIGPGLAARIVAFRALNGPFATLGDLLDVAGVTERKLDAIDPYTIVKRASR
jgi:competence protein ComEA